MKKMENISYINNGRKWKRGSKKWKIYVEI